MKLFHNPVKITFGQSSLADLDNQISGKVILVFCTKRFLSLANNIKELNFLKDINLTVIKYTDIESNPTIDSLEKCYKALGNIIPNTIIAIGGGSVLDFAKAYKAYLSSESPFTAFKEGLYKNTTLKARIAINAIAIPTTSGTGSEVTPFSTIWDTNSKKKLSISDESLFYDSTIIDPNLTRTLPYNHTLFTSLDAFNQALESLWNINSNEITQSFAIKAIGIGLNTMTSFSNSDEPSESVRKDLSLMSLLSGLSISHTRTALCHSISYPLTIHYGVPHGLACAFTMSAVLASNIRHDSSFINNEILLLSRCTSVNEFEKKVNAICIYHEVAEKVKEYIPSFEELTDLIPEMATPSRIKNNINPSPDIKSILYYSWYTAEN